MPSAGTDKDGKHKALPSRLLKAPQMRIVPEVSLPQLLTKYGQEAAAATAREVRTAPAASTKGAKAEASDAKGVSALLHEQSPRGGAGGALAGAKRALQVAEERAERRANSPPGRPRLGFTEHVPPGIQAPPPPVPATGRCCEYLRRRHVHPRLRWARLADKCDLEVGETADSPDAHRAGEGEAGHQAMPSFGQSGSSLQSGLPSTSLMKPSTSQSARSVDDVSLCAAASVVSDSRSAVEKRRRQGTMPKIRRPSSRPAILPRSNPSPRIRPGTVSTLHAALPSEPEAAPETQSLLYTSSSMKSFLVDPEGGSLTDEVRRNLSEAVDRKWFLRVAPISCLPSRASSQASRDTLKARLGAQLSGTASAGHYLNFGGWGVNDNYLDSLLSALTGLSGVKHVDLSGNQLTAKGVQILLDRGLLDGALSLNLASNKLGEHGACVVAMQQLARCRSIVELNLSGNEIGDVAAEELCMLLEQSCPDLAGLGLAQCNIGVSSRVGTALGAYVRGAINLKSLDVNWNVLHGEGAVRFLMGLWDSISVGVTLRRLNLGWNRLGSGGLNASEARKDPARRAAKMLASVFQDGKSLFHVDLSYNSFDAEECGILAVGLKKNFSIFGIHLIGNEAIVDDLGFIVPLRRQAVAASLAKGKKKGAGHGGVSAAAGAAAGGSEGVEHTKVRDSDANGWQMASLWNREGLNAIVRDVPNIVMPQHPVDVPQPRADRAHQLGRAARQNPSLQCMIQDMEGYSEEDITIEQHWVAENSRVHALGSVVLPHEAVQRDVSCCWVCENWTEHTVCYIPGVSGHETSADEVDSVCALYSIDGFTRPTWFTRKEDNAQKRAARRSVRLSMHRHTHSSLRAFQPGAHNARRWQPMGFGVKWVGHRSLPPSMKPIEFVFIVNDCATVAEDLPKAKLPEPITVTVPEDPRFQRPGSACSGSAGSNQMEVDTVNTVTAAVPAISLFRSGRPTALCVMEDPKNRGEIVVFPRQLVESEEQGPADEGWKFETSCFKDFNRDTQAAVEKCFDVDWQNSKLQQLVKNPETRTALAGRLRTLYAPVIQCFWHSCYPGFDNPRIAPGISFHAFREVLSRHGGEGDEKLIDGQNCKSSDPDCIFVAANVIEKERRRDFPVLPDKGLSRFQFLEAVVRLAFRRFPAPSKDMNPEAAMHAAESLLEMLQLGEEAIALRTSLHEALFTEECCMVYRVYHELLQALYDEYKKSLVYPGRNGKLLSYGAWLEMLTDAGAISQEWHHKNIGTAFALGKEIRADETSGWRHMELSWGEFLVALGAVVRLRQDYDPQFFADMLEEFFAENLEDARSRIAERKPGNMKLAQVDPALAPLVTLVSRIFQDADEDNSGSVGQREFRRALAQPQFRDEMRRIGLNVQDVGVFFRMMDADGSGVLTLEELCEGFIQLKQSMKGVERAVSYIRKIFSEADADGSGFLDRAEVSELFSHPSVAKKLTSLGISTTDTDDIFDLMGDVEEVSVDQIIDVLLKLRDPSSAGLLGVRLLERLFAQADEDGSGGLSAEEVMNTFASDEVTEKLEKKGLKVPDWEVLFEELDVDGSGDLSWEEIKDGMSAFWARAKFAEGSSS